MGQQTANTTKARLCKRLATALNFWKYAPLGQLRQMESPKAMSKSRRILHQSSSHASHFGNGKYREWPYLLEEGMGVLLRSQSPSGVGYYESKLDSIDSPSPRRTLPLQLPAVCDVDHKFLGKSRYRETAISVARTVVAVIYWVSGCGLFGFARWSSTQSTLAAVGGRLTGSPQQHELHAPTIGGGVEAAVGQATTRLGYGSRF
jgi:hypothetical protein